MRIRLALLVVAFLSVPWSRAWAQAVETELEGVKASVVELRQSGGVLRLAVRFTNETAKAAAAGRYRADRIVLIDVKSKRKHLPLKDADGQFVAGPLADRLDGGRIAMEIPARQSSVVWVYFEPLPSGTVVNIEMPYLFPFENVTVTEGAGPAASASSAPSTPGGAMARIVSATRADQVVNVRMRLEADKGAAPDLGAYFNYRDVFLFDPAGKRKYALIKDAEGNFQASPNTVKGNGGSFILNWGKPTLVSLTFQAPPDSVANVDLFLPKFLPAEGIALLGLGGAATGGIAAAGTALGLEGALKELKAEVTATEIRIDLAADVLFDFDKATIKREAEPSLRHLAAVLKGNPGADVTIEGHTDGKGADAYNQTLSEQRAAAVKTWLVQNAQVTGAGIATRGWGKMKPIAPNANNDGSDNVDGRAKNRRVQVIVKKG